MKTTLVFSQSAGDWGVVGNWFDNTAGGPATALPGIADTAIVNQSNAANVNSVVGTTAGNLTVGNQLPGAGIGTTLNVNGGGSLNFEGTAFIGSNGSSSLLQVQGGSLTSVNTGSTRTVLSGYAADPGSSVLTISRGTFTARGSAASQVSFISAATVNISGGTVDMTGGQVVPQNNSVFNITGDAASITMDRLNMVVIDRSSNWNFTLGATGVSPVQNNSFLHLACAHISVDGSAYTGPGGIIDLFTAPNVASTTVNPADITGFGPEYEVVFEQSTGDNYAHLNISLVPEPSTFLIIAAGMPLKSSKIDEGAQCGRRG